MTNSIFKLETVQNNDLVNTFRVVTDKQNNRAIPNGHLTDGRKSKPPFGDSQCLQADRVERDGFCNTELIKMAAKLLNQRKGIRQTSTAYTLSGGVANVGAEEVKQTGNEQVTVIHTIPVMTDTERNAAKKRIGSDLYEIFVRIQAELQFDNENLQK